MKPRSYYKNKLLKRWKKINWQTNTLELIQKLIKIEFNATCQYLKTKKFLECLNSMTVMSVCV